MSEPGSELGAYLFIIFIMTCAVLPCYALTEKAVEKEPEQPEVPTPETQPAAKPVPYHLAKEPDGYDEGLRVPSESPGQ